MEETVSVERIEPEPGTYRVRVQGSGGTEFECSCEAAEEIARLLFSAARDPMVCEACHATEAGSKFGTLIGIGTHQCWICKQWFMVSCVL